MPLYNYKCDSCDFLFEEIRPIKGRHEATCPRCSEPASRGKPESTTHLTNALHPKAITNKAELPKRDS